MSRAYVTVFGRDSYVPDVYILHFHPIGINISMLCFIFVGVEEQGDHKMNEKDEVVQLHCKRGKPFLILPPGAAHTP